MDQFWKLATFVLIIFAFVAVLSHAAGFSTASGSLFGGLANLGKTIIGTG
jgi:hypothetical protein